MARRKKAEAAVTDDTPIPEETVTEPKATPESPPVEPRPDIFDEQIALRQQEAAKAIVQDVAEGMKPPEEQKRELDQPQGHADRVGKRQPGYDRANTDHVTGVTITEHRYPFLGIIRFAEKPSDEVRQFMKDRGFEWSDVNKEWNHPIGFESQYRDREHLRQTYDEVRKMIRAERGITHSYGGNTPG